MSRIFIQYDRYQQYTVDHLRLAVRSWQARGWDVRVLLPGKKAPRSARVIPPTVINYAFKRGKLRAVKFGARGWQKSPLVRFPETLSEPQILGCGRAL